jgi:subfamily B ATP-binding cassette protein MsbA
MGSGSSDSGGVYKRLLSYATRHRAALAAAIVANLLFAATDSGFAWLLKPALDGSFTQRDQSVVRLVPVAVLLLFAVRGAAGFFGEYCMNWVSRQVIMRLRGELFEQYLHLPCERFDSSSTGEMLSRLTYNIEQVAHSTTKTFTVMIRDSLTIIGLFGLMIYLNALLTLFIAVVAPMIGGLIIAVGKRFRRDNEKIQNAMGSVTRVAEEAIAGHRVIRIFNRQAGEAERFRAANNLHRRQHMRLVVAKSVSDATIMMLAAMGVASIVYVATLERMEITAGSFAAFLGAMMLIMAPLKRLTGVNASIQQGIAAGESIFAMLDAPREASGGVLRVERAAGHVRFEDVSFAYSAAKGPVLQDFSIDVQPGQTVAVVGRSGSGKSTLVALLPRFYDPQHGRILLDGHDLREYDLTNLREQIALVSQDVTLFNDTIAANIAYGTQGEVSSQVLRAAAEAAHVTEFADELPRGLDTVVGDRGVLLSGGQRQRISIARALLKAAPILILDEATSALDTQSERHIQDALNTLIAGRTTFVIAHRLSTIESADLILVLSRGRLVEYGTHDTLLAGGGQYADLHRMQYGLESGNAGAGRDGDVEFGGGDESRSVGSDAS